MAPRRPRSAAAAALAVACLLVAVAGGGSGGVVPPSAAAAAAPAAATTVESSLGLGSLTRSLASPLWSTALLNDDNDGAHTTSSSTTTNPTSTSMGPPIGGDALPASLTEAAAAGPDGWDNAAAAADGPAGSSTGSSTGSSEDVVWEAAMEVLQASITKTYPLASLQATLAWQVYTTVARSSRLAGDPRRHLLYGMVAEAQLADGRVTRAVGVLDASNPCGWHDDTWTTAALAAEAAGQAALAAVLFHHAEARAMAAVLQGSNGTTTTGGANPAAPPQPPPPLPHPPSTLSAWVEALQAAARLPRPCAGATCRHPALAALPAVARAALGGYRLGSSSGGFRNSSPDRRAAWAGRTAGASGVSALAAAAALPRRPTPLPCDPATTGDVLAGLLRCVREAPALHWQCLAGLADVLAGVREAAAAHDRAAPLYMPLSVLRGAGGAAMEAAGLGGVPVTIDARAMADRPPSLAELALLHASSAAHLAAAAAEQGVCIVHGPFDPSLHVQFIMTMVHAVADMRAGGVRNLAGAMLADVHTMSPPGAAAAAANAVTAAAATNSLIVEGNPHAQKSAMSRVWQEPVAMGNLTGEGPRRLEYALDMWPYTLQQVVLRVIRTTDRLGAEDGASTTLRDACAQYTTALVASLHTAATSAAAANTSTACQSSPTGGGVWPLWCLSGTASPLVTMRHNSSSGGGSWVEADAAAASTRLAHSLAYSAGLTTAPTGGLMWLVTAHPLGRYLWAFRPPGSADWWNSTATADSMRAVYVSYTMHTFHWAGGLALARVHAWEGAHAMLRYAYSLAVRLFSQHHPDVAAILAAGAYTRLAASWSRQECTAAATELRTARAILNRAYEGGGVRTALPYAHVLSMAAAAQVCLGVPTKAASLWLHAAAVAGRTAHAAPAAALLAAEAASLAAMVSEARELERALPHCASTSPVRGTGGYAGSLLLFVHSELSPGATLPRGFRAWVPALACVMHVWHRAAGAVAAHHAAASAAWALVPPPVRRHNLVWSNFMQRTAATRVLARHAHSTSVVHAANVLVAVLLGSEAEGSLPAALQAHKAALAAAVSNDATAEYHGLFGPSPADDASTPVDAVPPAIPAQPTSDVVPLIWPTAVPPSRAAVAASLGLVPDGISPTRDTVGHRINMLVAMEGYQHFRAVQFQRTRQQEARGHPATLPAPNALDAVLVAQLLRSVRHLAAGIRTMWARLHWAASTRHAPPAWYGIAMAAASDAAAADLGGAGDGGSGDRWGWEKPGWVPAGSGRDSDSGSGDDGQAWPVAPPVTCVASMINNLQLGYLNLHEVLLRLLVAMGGAAPGEGVWRYGDHPDGKFKALARVMGGVPTARPAWLPPLPAMKDAVHRREVQPSVPGGGGGIPQPQPGGAFPQALLATVPTAAAAAALLASGGVATAPLAAVVDYFTIDGADDVCAGGGNK